MAERQTSPIWRKIRLKPNNALEQNDVDIVETLKTSPLFDEFNKREIQRIAHIAHKRSYREGEVIFRQGQVSAGMYIIVHGEVKISRRSGEDVEIPLVTMNAGEFFGDIGLIDDTPRTATAIALAPSYILGLFRPDLLQLMDRAPKLASKLLFKLAQIVATRLRITDEQLENVMGELEHLRAEITSEKSEERKYVKNQAHESE